MKHLSRRLIIASASVAAAGFLAFGQDVDVSAATQWEARTVEEVTADLKASDNGEKTYQIVWGDTLGVISKAIDTPLNKLVAVNDIANADMIMSGTTIHVSADHSTVSYESEAGEVQSYDVSEEQVQEVAPEPVQEAAPEVAPEPVQASAPVEQAQPQPQPQPVQQSAPVESAAPAAQPVSSNAAKEEIAQRESTGSYSARNGRYIGRYQLDQSYLNGDFSPANQERVAEEYVSSRYGSWDAALGFWNANGWY